MSCTAACTVTVPAAASGGCNGAVTRPAGIDRFFFMACDQTFTDLTDLDEWTALITADKLHFTGQVKASKPKGAFTKKKTASCRPEQIVGGTKTINFTDSNTDASLTDYDFWEFVNTNQGRLLFGYVTCDELVYGPYDNWSVEVDDVRAEDSQEEMTYEGAISWLSKQVLKPTLVTGVLGIAA